jgi:hypothetical protein
MIGLGYPRDKLLTCNKLKGIEVLKMVSFLAYQENNYILILSSLSKFAP